MSNTVVRLGFVEFSPTRGVSLLGVDFTDMMRLTPRWCQIATILAEDCGADAGDAIAHLRAADELCDHPLLNEACCGGSGPLADLGTISFEVFCDIVAADHERQAQRLATVEAKRTLVRKRRTEFGSARPHLALALLNAGHEYRCCVAGCEVRQDLTIDHKFALSRGGTDDIENLQFMCRSHNSAKGDR
jgi:hypothetical protein